LVEELQVVIDDVVQNLRTALNYLVTALARFDSPQKKVPRSLQFPVERSADDFREHRPRYLRGVSPEHVAMIERAQPYNGCDWTGLLARFSNVGKHVELVTVTRDAMVLLPTPEDQTEWGDASWVKMDVDVVGQRA